MVDGVHGHVNHVVRRVVAHTDVKEVVTVPNLHVEEKAVLMRVMRQDHAVVAVQVIKLLQDLVTHMYINVYGMESKVIYLLPYSLSTKIILITEYFSYYI